jgi:uncharacterized protein (TIGR02145 family)
MKKFYAILCIAIASLTQIQAQAPQGFNYQATVRNSSGDLIINTNVYFKFNVMQGSQTSLPVFTEIHYAPTDDLGQVNLVIGQGTATDGVFSELDWSLGSYYLGIELDTGNGYVSMGTTQLLSVPYALYAENSGNSTPTTPNLETVLAENNSANNQQIKDLQDPTDAQDAVTKAYVDTNFATSNEPNIEQVLAQGNDANGIQLKGIADPTEAQDAVTKAYFENNSSNYFNLQYPDGITNETVIITYSNPFEVPSGKNFFINYAQKGVAIDNFDFDFSYPPNMAIGPGQTISNLDTNGFVLGFLTNAGVSPLTINLTSGDFTVPANKLFVYITDDSDFNQDTILINGFNPNPNGADSFGPLILGPESVISCQCVINGYLYEFFNDNSSGAVTDIDGNTYDYLTYGDQVWSVDNAEMVTYRDGTPIPEVTDPTQWSNLTTGAWCYYDNDPTKPRLYNWYAVMGIHDTDPNTPNKEFAPEGWHVPTDAEWTTLEEYLIASGYNYDGTTTGNKIAKAMASTTGWDSSTAMGAPGNDQSLNNSSGFNGFPVAGRLTGGSFSDEGTNADFWGSTESNTSTAWHRYLSLNLSGLPRGNFYKQLGLSVRFVRD